MASTSRGGAPPPPSEARQRPTRWGPRWVVGLVGVVLVLAVGVWAAARWWTTDPWPEMEVVASTFPVPEGFVLVDSVRDGDRPAVCDIKPCNRPQLTNTYVRTSASSGTCEAIEGAVEKWEQQGFRLDASGGQEGDVLCMFQGEISGDFVRVFGLASARDDDPGFELVVGG